MPQSRLSSIAPGFVACLLFVASGYAQPVEPHYDTIYPPAWSEQVALAVSNFGEVGQAGAGGVNIDFTASGLECGTRHADSVYLYSASPFILEADDTHTNVSLTCSYGQTSPTKPYSWIPVELEWESVQREFHCQIVGVEPVARLLSPDGHFAVELFRVSGFDAWGLFGFAFLTRVYAVDGEVHHHVTMGWVENWNVPSDEVDSNVCRTNGYGSVLYLQGTDTASTQACAEAAKRFASSAVTGAFSGLYQEGICLGDLRQERQVVGSASLLDDVENPPGSGDFRPDAEAWWNLIGEYEGRHIADSSGDLAIWNTAVHDFTVGYEPIYFWNVLATSYQNPVDWTYWEWRGIGLSVGDCAMDCPYAQVGDANGSGDDYPTIGDISVMVDAKFISGQCIDSGPGVNIRCFGEADINQSGGFTLTCDDITIGDIAMLIDALFVTGMPPFQLPCTMR